MALLLTMVVHIDAILKRFNPLLSNELQGYIQRYDTLLISNQGLFELNNDARGPDFYASLDREHTLRRVISLDGLVNGLVRKYSSSNEFGELRESILQNTINPISDGIMSGDETLLSTLGTGSKYTEVLILKKQTDRLVDDAANKYGIEIKFIFNILEQLIDEDVENRQEHRRQTTSRRGLSSEAIPQEIADAYNRMLDKLHNEVRGRMDFNEVFFLQKTDNYRIWKLTGVQSRQLPEYVQYDNKTYAFDGGAQHKTSFIDTLSEFILGSIILDEIATARSRKLDSKFDKLFMFEKTYRKRKAFLERFIANSESCKDVMHLERTGGIDYGFVYHTQSRDNRFKYNLCSGRTESHIIQMKEAKPSEPREARYKAAHMIMGFRTVRDKIVWSFPRIMGMYKHPATRPYDLNQADPEMCLSETVPITWKGKYQPTDISWDNSKREFRQFNGAAVQITLDGVKDILYLFKASYAPWSYTKGRLLLHSTLNAPSVLRSLVCVDCRTPAKVQNNELTNLVIDSKQRIVCAECTGHEEKDEK